nr:c-Myc-binding protein homolog [Parasteatoda tepidariorum]
MSSVPDMPTLGQNKNVAPTTDSETEEFRKYLESSGTFDVITRILKEMYEKEDKPADPLVYFTRTLGAVSFEAREINALKDEIIDLKSVIEELERENKILREAVDKSTA